MTSQLLQFVRSGAIGSLSLGLTKSQVIELRGIPGWWEGHRDFLAEKSDVWRYGALQLAFDNNRVSQLTVFCNSSEVDESESDFDVSSFFDSEIGSQTTVTDFQSSLRRLGLKCVEDRDDTRSPVVLVATGIVARFGRTSHFGCSMSNGGAIAAATSRLLSIRFCSKM